MAGHPLEQLRAGVGRAWGALAEGWQHLGRKAWDALTRFHPPRQQAEEGGALETVGEQALARSPRWGLLPADISSTDETLVVRVEVPGLDPGELEVSVEGGALRIRGEKRLEREEGERQFLLVERAYGSFERVIPLPVEVDPDGARARYRRGVLTVILPKSPRSRGRRVPVRAAEPPDEGEEAVG